MFKTSIITSVSEWLLFFNTTSAISKHLWKQHTLLDDQHAELDFYSDASSVKQSTYLFPLRHIILILNQQIFAATP